MNARTKRRTALYAVGLLSLLIVVAWFSSRWAADEGFRAGAAAGAQTLDRLRLVWPGIKTMPEDDRLVLADLAMRCRLQEEPLVAEAVVQCLRRATAGRDAARESAELARLLPSEYAFLHKAR